MKNKTHILTIFFLLSLCSKNAEACYSSRQFEAEQGIRIHSELMVIGLTCIKMPQGDTLYRKYQDFTRKHSNLISEYEAELISYYTQQGEASPEKNLHTLRTNIANEISRRAIGMGVQSFCQKFSSHIDQALAMDQPKIRRWAQHVWANQPTSEPACNRQARAK